MVHGATALLEHSGLAQLTVLFLLLACCGAEATGVVQSRLLLVAAHSLRPIKSVFINLWSLHQPGRPDGLGILPEYVLIAHPENGLNLQLSTSVAAQLQDSSVNWMVGVVNYEHVTSNQLRILSLAGELQLWPTAAEAAEGVDAEVNSDLDLDADLDPLSYADIDVLADVGEEGGDWSELFLQEAALLARAAVQRGRGRGAGRGSRRGRARGRGGRVVEARGPEAPEALEALQALEAVQALFLGVATYTFLPCCMLHVVLMIVAADDDVTALRDPRP